VARVERSIEECKKTLIDLGHAEFTFEDFSSDLCGTVTECDSRS
jgi:hypothetical protein